MNEKPINKPNGLGGRGFESQPGSEVFHLLRVGPTPFQGYHSEGIFRDIYIALQLTTFKPLSDLRLTIEQTLDDFDLMAAHRAAIIYIIIIIIIIYYNI